MRLELRMSGGVAQFPGLARPFQIDTDALPAEQAREIADLVAAAGFFQLPGDEGEENAQGGPRYGGRPDARSYVLTVEDGPRRHRVSRADPLPETLATLVNALRRIRRSQVPGA